MIAPVVHKRVLVVPYSDAKHNEEVYAVGHRWEAYWPDPGVERAKYGDKVICAYRHLHLAPFGPGWHVR